MMPLSVADRASCNRPRYIAGSSEGHYESWFQRANHPTERLAFWIRYTIFCPRGRPEGALGELWAIFFDGENGRIAAVKEEFPISSCTFGQGPLDVRIGPASLNDRALEGLASSPSYQMTSSPSYQLTTSPSDRLASSPSDERTSSPGHELKWSLGYESPQPPLLLLPAALYERSLPRAKALVGSPNATFRGSMTVDGETVAIDGWAGSQNHNWGSRHTDSYAWGQVAGFDGAPDTFLECSTAQLRIGPIWTPRMSLVVLRTGGNEYPLNSLAQSLRANGNFRFFEWRIESGSAELGVSIRITAPKSEFVALTYDNPPGGAKTCLNTKLAACELTLRRKGFADETFFTQHRAAFEILTDRADHGVPKVV
ncbi:MAG TPA: hypothetical protein VN634_07080 [Candidatus Limnocylindrales bacterium]|nr:hypothetical protein [Candidatus Limnocylindrales bacterium]